MVTSVLVAVRTCLVTLVITGLAYPLTVTVLGQLLFPVRVNGSLVHDDRGGVVGSELIGQHFAAPGYFWGRPSAAGAKGYDATASSGSNLGPSSAGLRQRTKAWVERLQVEHSLGARVPVDLATASGSGLDPHLTPQAAQYQVARVAKARGVAKERVGAVLGSMLEGQDLGFLGEPRVNVLLLNLALDHQFGAVAAPPPHAP